MHRDHTDCAMHNDNGQSHILPVKMMEEKLNDPIDVNEEV